MSVFICKWCNSMLYNLPASKIFIWLLVVPSFFEISIIASIINLRNFRPVFQVPVMIQPPLAIFAIKIWQGLVIVSSNSCRTGNSCLVVSRQTVSMLRPSLKVCMMHLVTIFKVSSSQRIAEDNFTILKSPSVEILIMQFFNEIWRRWVPSEWFSKNLLVFPSWYAANNLANNESTLLKPLTKKILGSSLKILVCGQRISATVNMFATIQLGGVRCNNNSNTICAIRSSHCNPPPHF